MKILSWLFAVLLTTATCNNITMGLSQTSLIVNATTTLTISLERTRDALGNVITPSPVTSQSIITVYLQGFNLKAVTCPANQTCIFDSNLINVTNFFASNTTVTTIVLVFQNLLNPTTSSTQLTLSAAITTSGNIIDIASTTYTLTAGAFLTARVSFSPGNVSYNSNLTLNLSPSVAIPDGGRVNITVPRFWKNSKKNSSSNIPAGVTCSTSCNISSLVSSFIISVSNVATPYNGFLTITILGIVSCPTTQTSDSLSIVSYEQSGNQLNINSVNISSTLPNFFNITSIQAGTINKNYDLVVTFTTANIFATNDTITIVLPPETTLTGSSTVTVSNSAVVNTGYQTVMPNTVQLSSNQINFANPATLTLTISNLTGITSTKPTTSVRISTFRNGFIYNYGQTEIIAANDILTATINTSSTIAAALANYTLTLSLSNPIPAGGYILVTLPINVTSHSINSSFSCTLSQSTLKCTANAISQKNIQIVLAVRNPVSSTDMIITIKTYDSINYLMDSGSVSLFPIEQGLLPSSVLNCTISSDTVYDIATYIFTIDLSGYQLAAGYAVITLPNTVTYANQSNVQCLFNNEPRCTINSDSFSFPISIGVTLYSISIGFIRNPPSTTPFSFNLQIVDSNGTVYYRTTSSYFSVKNPISIPMAVTVSNCTNGASAIYTLNFTMPTGMTIQQQTYKAYIDGIEMTSGTFNNPLSMTLTNPITLKQWQLSIIVKTSDSLFDVLKSLKSITNCQPSYLSITSAISGLPEDPTVMTVSTMTPADQIILYFPVEYTTNNLICTALSNLTCSIISSQSIKIIPQSSVQTVIFQLTNISNPLTSSFFLFDTYINGFLSSRNNDTMRYVAPCQLPCKGCLSNNTTACTSCLSTPLSILDPFQQTCVKSCNIGYYISGRVCEACPVECSACQNATACLSCASNFNLFQGTCLTECPSKYYPQNNVCKECQSPCSQCVSSTECKNCRSPYSYYQKQCLAVCPNNTISNGTQCIPCNSVCQTCQILLDNCTSCQAAYYLHNHQCLVVCPDGYVGINGTCLQCLGCQKCIGNQTICIECQSGFLYNSTCVATCPVSYYPSLSQCLSCPSECKQCTSPLVCQSCSTSYSLSNNRCVSLCPVRTMSYQSVCMDCITGCNTCSSLTTCDVCDNGYLRYNSSCVTSCPVKTYKSGSQCLACQRYCQECQVDVCTVCLPTYLIYNGTCYVSCPLSTAAQNGKCMDCSSLYEFCSNCNDLTCLQCDNSYILYNGTCIQSCPSGTVLSNSTCVKCPVGCATCSAVDNCTACSTPYLFLDNKCLLACPYPKIPDSLNLTCISCNPECLTCVTVQNCTKCNINYSLFNNSCLSSCPAAMYSQNNICQNCVEGCLECSSSQCDKCNQSYYLIRGGCYKTCPSDLPYSYDGSCNKCSQNCTSCTNQYCTQCQGQLLISGQYCVAECPANTTLSGKTCLTIEPVQPVTPITVQLKFLPCLLVFLILSIVTLISRMQYEATYTFGALSAFCGLTTIISCIILLIMSTSIPLFLLLSSVSVNILLNILFIIINNVTIKSDRSYNLYKRDNMVTVCLVNTLSLLSLKSHLLLFSRLFNSRYLRCNLDHLNKLNTYDIFMFLTLLSNILSIAAAGLSLGNNLYLSIDTIILCILDILLATGSKKRKRLFDEVNYEEEQVKVDKGEISETLVDNVTAKKGYKYDELMSSNKIIQDEDSDTPWIVENGIDNGKTYDNILEEPYQEGFMDDEIEGSQEGNAKKERNKENHSGNHERNPQQMQNPDKKPTKAHRRNQDLEAQLDPQAPDSDDIQFYQDMDGVECMPVKTDKPRLQTENIVSQDMYTSETFEAKLAIEKYIDMVIEPQHRTAQSNELDQVDHSGKEAYGNNQHVSIEQQNGQLRQHQEQQQDAPQDQVPQSVANKISKQSNIGDRSNIEVNSDRQPQKQHNQQDNHNMSQHCQHVDPPQDTDPSKETNHLLQQDNHPPKEANQLSPQDNHQHQNLTENIVNYQQAGITQNSQIQEDNVVVPSEELLDAQSSGRHTIIDKLQESDQVNGKQTNIDRIDKKQSIEVDTADQPILATGSASGNPSRIDAPLIDPLTLALNSPPNHSQSSTDKKPNKSRKHSNSHSKPEFSRQTKLGALQQVQQQSEQIDIVIPDSLQQSINSIDITSPILYKNKDITDAMINESKVMRMSSEQDSLSGKTLRYNKSQKQLVIEGRKTTNRSPYGVNKSPKKQQSPLYVQRRLIKQTNNVEIDKKYLKEGPCIEPYVFKNKKSPTKISQTIDVHINHQEAQQDETQFQANTITIRRYDNTKKQDDSQQLPKRQTSRIESAHRQNVGQSPDHAIRSQTAKTRKPVKKSGKDGIEQMLRRLEKNEHSVNKMKGLEQIYLRPFKK